MSWPEIKKAINSNLTKPLDTLLSELFTNTNSKIDTANTNVANSYSVLTNTTYGNSAIKTLLNTVNTNLTGGKTPVVKSVQRGTVQSSTTTTKDTSIEVEVSTATYVGYYVDIAIASVNMSKAIVLTDTFALNNNRNVMPVLINSTTLRVYCHGSASSANTNINSKNGFSWQVIEFY